MGFILLKWKKHIVFCSKKLVVGDLLGECDSGGGGGGVSRYALESMYHAEYLQERQFFSPTSMWLATIKSHETCGSC